MVEECTDHPGTTMHDGRVNGAESGFIGACIGALVEQELDQFFIF